jgi:hypothetical protein
MGVKISMTNNNDDEYLSNCCGYPIIDDTDICSLCKEHCISIAEQDRLDKGGE